MFVGLVAPDTLPAPGRGYFPGMAVRSAFPILYVDDVPASVRFYRDLLCFEEIYRFPDTDEPGYVALRLDDGKIGLSSADFPGIHGKPQRPDQGGRLTAVVSRAS